uniref:histidine kinase n=1 Tax=Oryza meridionalis TaxID=40149 RepID=A0A0E0E0E2_9ORYZ
MATASARAVAVVRIPILRESIYDGGGTPEVTEGSYTILVLLPPHDTAGGWSSHDLEIIQAVARASSASAVDRLEYTWDQLVKGIGFFLTAS